MAWRSWLGTSGLGLSRRVQAVGLCFVLSWHGFASSDEAVVAWVGLLSFGKAVSASFGKSGFDLSRRASVWRSSYVLGRQVAACFGEAVTAWKARCVPACPVAAVPPS